MPSYDIRAELVNRHDPGEVEVELITTHGSRISDFNLTVATTLTGRVVVTLTIDSTDLWIAMLTCMAVLDHSRYEVTSWSARTASDDELDLRTSAR